MPQKVLTFWQLVLYNYFYSLTKLFSDPYLAKFLDTLAKGCRADENALLLYLSASQMQIDSNVI